jgi:hypothetical protein
MSNTEPDRDLAEQDLSEAIIERSTDPGTVTTDEIEEQLLIDAAGPVEGSTLDDPDDLAGDLQ